MGIETTLKNWNNDSTTFHQFLADLVLKIHPVFPISTYMKIANLAVLRARTVSGVIKTDRSPSFRMPKAARGSVVRGGRGLIVKRDFTLFFIYLPI